MRPDWIQAFMMKNGECFDFAALQDVQQRLEALDDAKGAYMMSLSFQSPTLILILAILLGWERFFLDDIAMGVVKVLTCQGLGIWWLVDIFSAKRRACAYNYELFNRAMIMCG